MKISSPSRRQSRLTLAIAILAFVFLACSNRTITAPDRGLQGDIHYYIFDQQPVTGQEFVRWADQELTQYSSREVQKALYEEGKRQAKEGHPNAVAVLSYADQAWAEAKHLKYDRDQWYNLQTEAKNNMRALPQNDIQLWPPSK